MINMNREEYPLESYPVITERCPASSNIIINFAEADFTNDECFQNTSNNREKEEI